jgi:hypothetical protein
MRPITCRIREILVEYTQSSTVLARTRSSIFSWLSNTSAYLSSSALLSCFIIYAVLLRLLCFYIFISYTVQAGAIHMRALWTYVSQH